MIKKNLVITIVVFVAFLFLLEYAGISSLKIIDTALLAMTPLALAAIGEVINEKAGVTNIGLDGILLIGATLGVYGAELAGNGYIGLLFGALAGALIGFLHGVLSTYGRADQVVASMGINIFAYGFVPYFLMAVWHMPGIRVPPKEVLVQLWNVPLGNFYFVFSELTILALLLTFVFNWLLQKTALGLWIRAAGESPEAIDAAGIDVYKVRILTATIGSLLAGLGGAFMSLVWFKGVVKEISAGRGFIALACVVASGLDPILATGFAFLFGFSEAVAYTFAVTPGIKETIPYYFVFMIPYIVTLVVVAVMIGKRRFPRALGVPYKKE
ncbi:MAG: ABC transporter permease [Thermofilum sp.]